MRRAGTAVATAQGMSLVKCADDDPPAIGSELLDEHLNPIGRVVDVIGPVSGPYLVIDPHSDTHPTELLGEPLYVRAATA